MSKKDDYKVGYGKPPRHTQFQKGKSGNPTGKRARAQTTVDLLERELRKTIVITENGRERRTTKHEAMAMRCVHEALQGNLAARKLVLDLLRESKSGLMVEELPMTFTLKLEEDDDERFN